MPTKIQLSEMDYYLEEEENNLVEVIDKVVDPMSNCTFIGPTRRDFTMLDCISRITVPELMPDWAS